ncbi:OCIA domain-containing protein 2-like [Sinocyclocheilus grahami]|uniref:OCIA domain-containing protein 2-like n=1 Tax=Sinocyclocheilus grahami TaxID=75366 RepID=UPI0007ACC240|nr:PREDICTED: OCIA domain-containing protein 2-like [Sinocyclocheilus grahami]
MGGEGVVDAKPGQSGWKQFQCPIADPRFPREDIKQIGKECQYESFWYRALPLSASSMAVTGGLIYSGKIQSTNNVIKIHYTKLLALSRDFRSSLGRFV